MLGATTALAVLLAGASTGACFAPAAELDRFRMEWFCKQLAAAQEGLFEASAGIRFVWIPTFHPTRVVTVLHDRDTVVLTGKVLDGAGGYEPGQLVRTTKRELTRDEWELLLHQFEQAELWQEEQEDDRIGLDGSEWVVEARRNGRYVFRAVWSPDKSSFPQYRRACERMLTLADIHPGPDAIY